MNTKNVNRIFARAMYGVIIVAMMFFVTSVAQASTLANKKEPVGERISVYEDGSITFLAGQPFHMMHGWIQTSEDDAIGVFDFALDVDGVPRREDYKDFLAESGDPDTLQRFWVFNFPEGMSGEHIFTGHWFAPCQYAVDSLEYTDACPTRNAKVETHSATLFVTFIKPTFVAYVPGAIEGYDWRLGDTVSIDINDGQYTAEAEVEESTWEGEQTRVLFEVWRDEISIEAGDHIVMTDGMVSKDVVVTNLAVTDIDVTAGTVSGIYDPDYDLWVWLSDQEWQQPKTNPEAGTWVATFVELLPGASGSAVQWEPDGDGTSIDFQVPVPTFVAYLPYAIEGYDWPMGDEISLTINDISYPSATSEQRPDFPEGMTRVFFDVGQYEITLQTNDHIVMTDESAHVSKEVWVTDLAVTNFDLSAGQVSGAYTYDPESEDYLWVWLYDGDGQVPTMNPDGTWIATFNELPPGAWGGATQWDQDGDGTSIDFQIPYE